MEYVLFSKEKISHSQRLLSLIGFDFPKYHNFGASSRSQGKFDALSDARRVDSKFEWSFFSFTTESIVAIHILVVSVLENFATKKRL